MSRLFASKIKTIKITDHWIHYRLNPGAEKLDSKLRINVPPEVYSTHREKIRDYLARNAYVVKSFKEPTERGRDFFRTNAVGRFVDDGQVTIYPLQSVSLEALEDFVRSTQEFLQDECGVTIGGSLMASDIAVKGCPNVSMRQGVVYGKYRNADLQEVYLPTNIAMQALQVDSNIYHALAEDGNPAFVRDVEDDDIHRLFHASADSVCLVALHIKRGRLKETDENCIAVTRYSEACGALATIARQLELERIGPGDLKENIEQVKLAIKYIQQASSAGDDDATSLLEMINTGTQIQSLLAKTELRIFLASYEGSPQEQELAAKMLDRVQRKAPLSDVNLFELDSVDSSELNRIIEKYNMLDETSPCYCHGDDSAGYDGDDEYETDDDDTVSLRL
ncbi:MAG: hypothetical protein P1U34_11585 [Coxiellaceae bacterium]|nr:hypothetical protein [Coxiellaceae bacterium]